MAVGAIAALLALDVQTYGRLTYERPVATIQTRQLGPQYFEATVMQPGMGENAPGVSNLYPLHGDEWRIEAQVLKWKPWANVLGLGAFASVVINFVILAFIIFLIVRYANKVLKKPEEPAAPVPQPGLGEAINDRLKRAAGYIG